MIHLSTPRPGAQRKPPHNTKGSFLRVRVSPSIRVRLELAAARAGVSISREDEARLERSFEAAP